MATNEKSQLHFALLSSGKCANDTAALKKIAALKAKVAQGKDPEKLLHNMGMEPDYIYDIMP